MSGTEAERYDPLEIDELRVEVSRYLDTLPNQIISQIELDTLGTQFQTASYNTNEEGLVEIDLQGGRILERFATLAEECFQREEISTGFDFAKMLLNSGILFEEKKIRLIKKRNH